MTKTFLNREVRGELHCDIMILQNMFCWLVNTIAHEQQLDECAEGYNHDAVVVVEKTIWCHDGGIKSATGKVVSSWSRNRRSQLLLVILSFKLELLLNTEFELKSTGWKSWFETQLLLHAVLSLPLFCYPRATPPEMLLAGTYSAVVWRAADQAALFDEFGVRTGWDNSLPRTSTTHISFLANI